MATLATRGGDSVLHPMVAWTFLEERSGHIIDTFSGNNLSSLVNKVFLDDETL